MNQKGEVTLLSMLLILTLSGLILLSSLELRKSFKLLEKRTQLFLCVKETKGEFHHFMKFMGRTNWGIKNINRVGLIMMFIPGLQGASMESEKLKKYLQYAQEARLVSYLKTLNDLRSKSCPLDPRMFITPFKLGTRLFQRNAEGAVVLREEEWTYYFLSKPYLLQIKTNLKNWERVKPKMEYQVEEKAAKLSFLWSSL